MEQAAREAGAEVAGAGGEGVHETDRFDPQDEWLPHLKQ